MGSSSAITALLVLTVITITRGQQYYDILQGLQQLFQPYQGNDFVNQYNGATRTTTHKQTNRQENKKKSNEQRHQNEGRRTKKPPTNQYDYVFATTEKPSRKTTKSNSSQNNSNSRPVSNKNQSSNILLSDYYIPLELTTKANKVKTTTTEVNYNNYYNNNDVSKATTQNVFGNNFNGNIPITENVFENVNRKENYPVNIQQPSNIYENENNRRPANLINNPASNEYNNNFAGNQQNINNNQNRGNSNGNNNRGILNTDYNVEFPSFPVSSINGGTPNNNRNTNDFGTNNNGFLNINNNPDFNNFGVLNDFNRPAPNRRVPNEYDRGTNNNFGNTGVNSNNRGTTNFNTNNRGTSNNFGNTGIGTNNRGTTNSNTNNRGTTSNFNTNSGNTNNFNQGNNNFNPNRNTFLYPDNPLINRPGVQPAPVDVGLPPITNRPVSDKNNFFNRPPYPSSVTVTDQPDLEPEILIGPDEDDMSDRQKKRFVDMAERMCDRYKSLTIKKVVALPLIPSPDPVELNVSDCIPINVPLVIGGTVATIRDFPHMALLGWLKTRNAGYSWKCGGSLISDEYVLTAGHCTYQDKDYDVVSGPPQAVQLGSSYLDDPGALVVKISAVIRHPKYKQRRAYHDIALIKLVSKVTFSEVIRPACLGVPPPVGRSIIATGWGRTEFGGDHSSQLRSVSLSVWNMDECREIWGTSLKLPNGVTPDSHMCAGEKSGGKDTCQGDSGGPAQIQDGCLWRVVAVTSFGRSCGAPHTPALYAIIPRAFIAAQVFADQRL